MSKNTITFNTKERPRLLLLAGAIALFTFICFSPSLKNNFINWDDNAHVFENPHLAKPLSEAIGYFFGPHSVIGNYIPITMLVYTLEYHAAGLDAHFFHAVNLWLHVLNVLLVFWFIYRLSGRKLIVAAAAAVLFGIHPMHVESVAWISELKDLLYTCFFMLGLIAYRSYKEQNYQGVKFLIPAFFCFVLSVLSKPAAVVFPLVLLLLDYYQERPSGKKLWLEKIPFFLISIVFGIITIKAQQADRLLHYDYSLIEKACFASHSLLLYLLKCILPVGLSIFHPYPMPENGHLPVLYYLSPPIILASFYALYRASKHSRLLVFGFLFFFVNVLLVLQLISAGDAVMAERYTYVSYTGLFFMAAMGLEQLYRKRQSLVLFGFAAIVLVFAFLTHQRCKAWYSDNTIADDLLAKYPGDRLALNNKGYILYENKLYQESIPLFQKAVELKPDYTMAYINLVNSYLALNDRANAMNTLDTALKYVSGDVNLFDRKGQLLMAAGNYTEALVFFKKALLVKPGHIRTHMDLSECYFNLKDYGSSMKAIDTGLKHDPANYILWNNKGYVLMVTGKPAEAIQYFEKSLIINPQYSTASVNLDNCRKALK